MNKKAIITALLAIVLMLTSCHQSAQKAEAELKVDSTEAIINTDTLRLVVRDKELTSGVSCVNAIIINQTKQDVSFGAEYTI
jgi:PBP1b-binding outer membrane lipoprotein LpoB